MSDELFCPKCHREQVEITESTNFEWDFNHNSYKRTIFCYCHHCHTDWSMDEVWECVGFDYDSVKEM